MILQATLALPIYAFLGMCDAVRAPKSVWRKIKSRYEALLPMWEAKADIDNWFVDKMAEVERRVVAGEDTNELAQELERECADRYGVDPGETPEGAES